MTLKKDEKFDKEMSCRFKTGLRNLTNFDPSTQKSQNFQFNGFLFTKVYNV